MSGRNRALASQETDRAMSVPVELLPPPGAGWVGRRGRLKAAAWLRAWSRPQPVVRVEADTETGPARQRSSEVGDNNPAGPAMGDKQRAVLVTTTVPRRREGRSSVVLPGANYRASAQAIEPKHDSCHQGTQIVTRASGCPIAQDWRRFAASSGMASAQRLPSPRMSPVPASCSRRESSNTLLTKWWQGPCSGASRSRTVGVEQGEAEMTQCMKGSLPLPG